MSLTDAEFGLLQRNIDAVVERIAALNLTLVIERDFEALSRFLRSIPGAFIYPSFDPLHNKLNVDNSFWFRLVDEDGVTVASHADRIFDGEDFYDLIATGRLWYEKGLESDGPARSVDVIGRPEPPVAGRLGHSGSMWIHPRYRKQGLSLYLPYLSRALCIRNYETDFHTGLVFKSLAESDLPRYAYGYPHLDLCVKGYFPPTRREEEVYACYISREESFDQILALARHPRFPIAA